jgi:hypothetical protein
LLGRGSYLHLNQVHACREFGAWQIGLGFVLGLAGLRAQDHQTQQRDGKVVHGLILPGLGPCAGKKKPAAAGFFGKWSGITS